MADAVAHAFKELIVHTVVDLPFSLLIIRFLVWMDALSVFELPSPSWRQTWGIALLFIVLSS